ncbi:hypothetical protein ACFOD4_09730 [Pseudoroseomonas globiformis]|uniref:Uncharacterized protein n=1 Tax=Teichococcus globiformis TaxID=2307229 RepID=A0ABV7FY72_9PROT
MIWFGEAAASCRQIEQHRSRDAADRFYTQAMRPSGFQIVREKTGGWWS